MKLKSEEAVLDLTDDTFSPTVFRMATLFGLSDRMRFDLVINLLTVQAALEKKFSIFGGKQWRPFMHVSDAADAYITCLESPLQKVKGQIFNVGSDEFNYQLLGVGKLIAKIISDAVMELKENDDKRNYNVSFEKIRKALNFHCKNGVTIGTYEILKAIKEGKFLDYKASKYSNVEYLKGK
jgi:nucleoside-diphosphate-sugar epimerase